MQKTSGIAGETVAGRALDLVEDVKPLLRGWFHVVAAPVALAVGVPLVALAPAGPARNAAVVFVGCTLLNFSVSAALHRGRWSPRTSWVMTRLDHASIFLLIAGSYTSIALLLLEGRQQRIMIAVIWSGAVVAAWSRIIWNNAPRWGHVAVYGGLALLVAFFLKDIGAQARPDVAVMLGTAVALYLAGGIVYALRRPNPLPGRLGFHEVFHGLTVLAFAAHYSAVAITVHSWPASGAL